MRFHRLLLIILFLLIIPFGVSAQENVTIRVGIFPFEPMNFIDDDGNAQGFYPDLIRELVRGEDWNVVFVPGTWTECLERLQSGQIDLLTSIAFTPERAEIYDYNKIPVVDIWGQLFVRPGNKVNNFADLQGQKVAIVAKDINGRNFIKTSEELGIVSELVAFPTHEDVFRAVANRDVVAGVSAQHYGLLHAGNFGLAASSLKFSPLALHFAALNGQLSSVLEHIDTHLVAWKNDKDSFYYEKLAYWINGTAIERHIVPKWLIACLLGTFLVVLLLTYLNRSLRREATERSTESETRFKALIEQFGDAVFISDSTGRMIDVNVQACESLGYTREELLALHVTNIDHELSGKDKLQNFMDNLPLNQRVLLKSTHKRKNGSIFPVEIQVSHLIYEGNEIVFGMARDVTERTKSEAVLAARIRLIQFAHNHSSRDILQAFLDEAEHITSSCIGFFHYVDEAQQTLTSQMWSSNTLKNMCRNEGAEHPYSIKQAGVWADCIRERNPVVHNDYMSLSQRKGLPDGHAPVTRELLVPVFDDEKIVAVLGVGNKESDYTDHDVEIVQEMAGSAWELIARKRAEEELAARERVYRRTHFSVEHSHSAMVWLDFNGRITDFNRKLSFYTGFSREELLGRSVEDIHPEWTKERLEDDALPILVHGRSPARFETEILRKDQTKLPVSIELSRFEFEGDDMLLAVVTDVSRRKNAEQIQAQLEVELRQSQKMEAIGTLAGGVAHDFNNILTSMIGCTEMAIRRCGDDERLGKYLGVVRDGERRASELVAQILTFARKDDALIMAPLQLAETISEVMTLLRASIPATVDIHTSIAENCRLVMANSSQIHQVVMNLATNAYQALPEGKGKLDVELREERVTVKDAMKLLKIRPGEYLVLSIIDNGCGMSSEQMERIFDPYFTTRHINGGTGFGLTIVQQVVQSHSGTVVVKSTPDEGSVFEVYLPLLNGGGTNLPADAEEDDRVELISGGEQVLLVDDEAEIRFVFKEGLEELGYRVVIARDAVQAMELLNESPFKYDAVVSDMAMPIMSGADLAKMVQQVNEFVPVVLMSGYVKNGICKELECKNIQEILQKPIDVEGVARALRRALVRSENKRDIMAVN